jgi:ribosomal protein S18 acetylase RimI-like enzyme
MSSITISPATDEEVRSGDIGRRLRQFNYGYVGEYPEMQPIRLNARNEAGVVVGGLRAFVFLYWLRVEVLWVDEPARGVGLGSRLLRQAEDQARAHGAQNAALETFEWQAPGFYAKQGYEEVARIDGYAKGFYLCLMKKAL